jgi:hypothetical protein
MRIGSEGPDKEGPGSRHVAETALDHAAVEELERIARAESQRSSRMRTRLAAAIVPVKRPRQHVLGLDALSLSVGETRAREGAADVDVVVEVDVDAARVLVVVDEDVVVELDVVTAPASSR